MSSLTFSNFPDHLTMETCGPVINRILDESAEAREQLVEEIAGAGVSAVHRFLAKVAKLSPQRCAQCYLVIRDVWGGNLHPLGFDETAKLLSDMVEGRSYVRNHADTKVFDDAITDLIGGIDNPEKRNLIIEAGLHFRSYSHFECFDEVDSAMANHLSSLSTETIKKNVHDLAHLFREISLPKCVTKTFELIACDMKSSLTLYQAMLEYSSYDDGYLNSIFSGMGSDAFALMHSAFLDDREMWHVTQRLIVKHGSAAIFTDEIVGEISATMQYGTPVILAEMLRHYHEIKLHENVQDLYFNNLEAVVRDNRSLIPTKLADDAVRRGEGTRFIDCFLMVYAEHRLMGWESEAQKAAALDGLMSEQETATDSIFTIQCNVMKAVAAGGFEILPDYTWLAQSTSIRKLLSALGSEPLDMPQLAQKHPLAKSALISESLSL